MELANHPENRANDDAVMATLNAYFTERRKSHDGDQAERRTTPPKANVSGKDNSVPSVKNVGSESDEESADPSDGVGKAFVQDVIDETLQKLERRKDSYTGNAVQVAQPTARNKDKANVLGGSARLQPSEKPAQDGAPKRPSPTAAQSLAAANVAASETSNNMETGATTSEPAEWVTSRDGEELDTEGLDEVRDDVDPEPEVTTTTSSSKPKKRTKRKKAAAKKDKTAAPVEEKGPPPRKPQVPRRRSSRQVVKENLDATSSSSSVVTKGHGKAAATLGPRRESGAEFLKSIAHPVPSASDDDASSSAVEQQHMSSDSEISLTKHQALSLLPAAPPQQTEPAAASPAVARTLPKSPQQAPKSLAHAPDIMGTVQLPEALDPSICADVNVAPSSPAAKAAPLSPHEPVKAAPAHRATVPTHREETGGIQPAPALAERQRSSVESVESSQGVAASDSVSPELAAAISATKEALRPLISRPKLTTKLLRRPPFAFLHAVVSEVVRHTGFGASLFSPRELWRGEEEGDTPHKGGHGGEATTEPKAYPTSRGERIRFLVRIIACVSFVGGEAGHFADLQTLLVPAKVLAGQEPILTNRFLQALAQVAQGPPGQAREAERRTLEMGEERLYADAIKRRGSVTRIQANVRGFLTRKRLRDEGMMSAVAPKEATLQRTGVTYVTPSWTQTTSKREAAQQQLGRKGQTARTALVMTTHGGQTEDEPMGEWHVEPRSQTTTPNPVPPMSRDRMTYGPELLVRDTRAEAHEPEPSYHEGRTVGSLRHTNAKELKELKRKAEEADKYLAMKQKQDELVEKSLRARQKAERQLSSVAGEKEALAEELKKAVESHKRLAETLKRAMETKRRMEDELKKKEQLQAQSVVRRKEMEEAAAPHGSQEVPGPVKPSSITAHDEKLFEIEMRKRELEKRAYEVHQLEIKLQQKKAETDKLKEWESQLKQREERIERLASKLRMQRDKLKETQQQTETHMMDYEMRLKALERLSMTLVKQQPKGRGRPRNNNHDDGHLPVHKKQHYSDAAGRGPAAVGAPLLQYHEEAPLMEDGLADEGGEKHKARKAGGGQGTGKDKGEEEPLEEGGGGLSSIFEEMIEHSNTVVNILPQLVEEDRSDTESMSVPLDRLGERDSDVIPEQEKLDLAAAITPPALQSQTRQPPAPLVSESSDVVAPETTDEEDQRKELQSSESAVELMGGEGVVARRHASQDANELLSDQDSLDFITDWYFKARKDGANPKLQQLMNRQGGASFLMGSEGRPQVPGLEASMQKLFQSRSAAAAHSMWPTVGVAGDHRTKQQPALPVEAASPAGPLPAAISIPQPAVLHQHQQASVGGGSGVASVKGPPVIIETKEQKDYRICLARIETFLRKRKTSLEGLMPPRPSHRIPGMISLRDFRLMLHEINRQAEVFVVLSRAQIDLVQKLAPRTEGTSIDQKALEAQFRKAFAALGPQKFVHLPPTSIDEEHGARGGAAFDECGTQPMPISAAAGDPVSIPRKRYSKASGAAAASRHNELQSSTQEEPQRLPGTQTLAGLEFTAYPAAADSGDDVSVASPPKTKVKSHKQQQQQQGLKEAALIAGVDKGTASQLAWLSSFDTRFEDAIKRLEVVRDHAVLSRDTLG